MDEQLVKQIMYVLFVDIIVLAGTIGAFWKMWVRPLIKRSTEDSHWKTEVMMTLKGLEERDDTTQGKFKDMSVCNAQLKEKLHAIDKRLVRIEAKVLNGKSGS